MSSHTPESGKELARQTTAIANFISENPEAFVKGFVDGLRSIARRVSLDMPIYIRGIDLGPGDAIDTMERLNLTEETALEEGHFLIGGGNDLRITPEIAAGLIGLSFGVGSGDSLLEPINYRIHEGGGE